MHDDELDDKSELACYYCLVDQNKYELTKETYEKEYYTALARERYISKRKCNTCNNNTRSITTNLL